MQRANLLTLNNIIIFGVIIFGILLGVYTGYKGFSHLTAALLISIVFVILTLIKPWIAISAFFFLIPLENLYVFQTSVSFTATKLLGAYLIFIMIITGSLQHIRDVFKNKKSYWIIAFGLAAILSIIFSKDPYYSITYLTTLMLSIITYFVLIVMVRDIKIFNYAILALLAGVVLSALSPLVFGFGEVEGDSLKRYGGLWGDQNEFAAILLVTMPLCISIILTARRNWLKIITAFSCVVIFSGFLLTYSRSGFLAFSVMSLLALFKFVRGKNRFKILAIAVPCIIIALVVIYHTISFDVLSRLETLKLLEDERSIRSENSMFLRYKFYFDVGPKLFLEHPVLGVGFRGFVLHNPYEMISHSTYLEVLSGTGLVGFIPFMMIIYLTFKELWGIRNNPRTKTYDQIIISYSNALELGFISYLFVGIFYSLDINKMLWLLITLPAILVNISRIHRENASNALS